MGEYEETGTAHGAPRYKRLATSLPQAGERWLFRSPAGRWSVSASEAEVETNKKVFVMSSGASESPLGQQYRFYSGTGTWKADASLQLADVSVELVKRKRKHEESARAAAKAREDADTLRTLEARQHAATAQAALERRAKEARAGELAAAQRAAAQQAKADGEAAEKYVIEQSLAKARQQRVDDIIAEKAARKAALQLAEAARLEAARMLQAEEDLAKQEEARLFEVGQVRRRQAEAEDAERARRVSLTLVAALYSSPLEMVKPDYFCCCCCLKVAAADAMRAAALEAAAHAAAAAEAEELLQEAARMEEAVRVKTVSLARGRCQRSRYLLCVLCVSVDSSIDPGRCLRRRRLVPRRSTRTSWPPSAPPRPNTSTPRPSERRAAVDAQRSRRPPAGPRRAGSRWCRPRCACRAGPRRRRRPCAASTDGAATRTGTPAIRGACPKKGLP
jgi:chemotaxis protein histidine kinase CheA